MNKNRMHKIRDKFSIITECGKYLLPKYNIRYKDGWTEITCKSCLAVQKKQMIEAL